MKHIYIIAILIAFFASSTCAQKKTSKQTVTSEEVKTANEKDSINAIMKAAENGDAVCQNVVGMWYYKGVNYPQDYKQAYKWWAKSAAQNNVEAIGNLGLLFQYGRGVDADSVKAQRCYLNSIKSGNKALLQQREDLSEKGGDPFNSILTAICYQEGYGTTKSLTKALHFYELAAKCNSVDAFREIGFIYQKKGSSAAVGMFEKAASKGDIASAYQFAKAVLNNPSKYSDKEQEGVIYLIKAAEAGNAQAQCDLGTYYYQGKHVTKDLEKAVEWFKKSAVGEWALGQWNLALCYMDGVGIVKNYDEALYWFGEATARGYMQQFEKMCNDGEKGWKDKPFMNYVKGMSQYCSNDIVNAYEEFKKIKKNVVEAQTMMAICMANKDYKKHNAKKAAKELIKISDTGNAMAMFFLASLYEAGNGIEKDKDIALSIYQKSAEAGYATAQCYLGNLYYEGRLVNQDYSSAVKYYQYAEKQGRLTETAASRYADCIEKGLGGLKADKTKAIKLRKKDIKNHVAAMLQKVK